MLFWSLRTESSQTTPYEEVRALQQKIVELRAQDLIEDTVLFLEHEPVITQGRGLQQSQDSGKIERHMPIPKLPDDVEFFQSERGGDLTYHGPGQLVIYPIFKMDGKGFAPVHDVAGYLRKLEQVLISELEKRFAGSSVESAESVKDATGVWIKLQGESKGLRKIASIGIAVRKWVSYHGAALNCVNDLKPYQLISPCGFSPEVMTRLQDWVSLPKAWRPDLESSLAQRFAAESMDGEAVQIDALTLTEARNRIEKIEADARLIASQL